MPQTFAKFFNGGSNLFFDRFWGYGEELCGFVVGLSVLAHQNKSHPGAVRQFVDGAVQLLNPLFREINRFGSSLGEAENVNIKVGEMKFFLPQPIQGHILGYCKQEVVDRFYFGDLIPVQPQADENVRS